MSIQRKAEEKMGAESYIEHARVANHLAGVALEAASKDVATVEWKYSIGLSAQAIELACKGVLTALGLTTTEIIDQHGKHQIAELLDDVSARLNPDRRLTEAGDAWLSGIGSFLKADGVTLAGTTVEGYVKEHFTDAPASWPRNYFYPDQNWFTASAVRYAAHGSAEALIGAAERAIGLLTTSDM